MGLDMYLYLEKYESCSRFNEDYKQKKDTFYPEELEVFKIDERNFMSKETLYQIGYWRKANAIHNWIVTNCADGEDRCQRIYLTTKDLEKLLSLVNQVLENHDLADQLLPTVDGFFFGNKNYDEWYFKDLEYTKELLEKLLAFMKDNKMSMDYDIIYQASW